MASHICSIVPPYLLRDIGNSKHKEIDEETRQSAQRSLQHAEKVTAKRCNHFATLSQPRAVRTRHITSGGQHQSVVPEVFLQHVAGSEHVDQETRDRARRDMAHIRRVTMAYQKALATEQETEPQFLGFYRAVYDAKNDSNEEDLPGQLLRVQGQNAVTDSTANEAYDNVGKVLQFYLEKFNWKSIDNRNMHVLSSVHFGERYENAFWDHDKMQMVFGDGDKFLHDFTGCLDVIGHELTHAVTEYTSPLVYEGQAGALNEHVSDVFGIMVKQMFDKKTADEADWLIGEGCLLPGVKGVALRSMKAPGTAYNDPRFGKDPQPDSMAKYTPTAEDNGGVHLYSGIPNRAFYLASVAFGGYSWEKAGKIWWTAMTSHRVPPRCNFVQFADVTTEVAEELYSEEDAKIVRGAWNKVGVVRKH